MAKKKEKSPWVRLLQSISSLALMGAATYIIIAGFNVVATVVLLSSFGSIAGTAILAADGIIDGAIGFFEVLIEGLLGVVEAITDVFTAWFS